MSCASDAEDGYAFLGWSFFQVGNSASVIISSGLNVMSAQRSYYAVVQSGSRQVNLTILNTALARAGTYICTEGTLQASAQLVVINSDPVYSMTPNAPTQLLYNDTVQMSSSITYTANSYVGVDMICSTDNPATIVTGAILNITNSSNLITAVSTITQTPGYRTPFPIHRCNTTFTITGNPSGSAGNAPDYSSSSLLFNSSIEVLYLRPANESSITGAKDLGHVYLGTTLTCAMDGNPPPSYSWLDVTYSNTTNNSAIKIWHDGEYRCTASNTVASTSVPINVKVYNTTANPDASHSDGGQTASQNTIIGVVAGVGGALVIAAVAIIIYCRRKKNKADRYSSGSEGTQSKSPAPPAPHDGNGHPGSQRSSNPDISQGYQMDDYPKDVAPDSTTAGEHQDRPPYIENEGLNYAEPQLDSNPRSGQPLQVAPQESTYSEVKLA